MSDFVNGDVKILYIKQDNQYLPIACLDGNSINESSDEIDTTTRDNGGWKTSLPTNQGYEISFSGLIENNDLDATKTTYFNLKQLKRDRELIEYRIGSGTNYDYGSAYVIDLNEDSPASELITFSGTLRGFGRPKNYLLEIYTQWRLALESETSGSVSSKNCVINTINGYI